MARWMESLQTSVVAIEYDPVDRRGRILMPVDCCPDMTGAVAMFTAIDPDVQRIEAFAGSALDTTYSRDERGPWRVN